MIFSRNKRKITLINKEVLHVIKEDCDLEIDRSAVAGGLGGVGHGVSESASIPHPMQQSVKTRLTCTRSNGEETMCQFCPNHGFRQLHCDFNLLCRYLNCYCQSRLTEKAVFFYMFFIIYFKT